MPKLSRLGRYAVRYAELGYHVFPLYPRSKIPFSKEAHGLPDDAPGGVHMGSADPAQVRAWWERWPDANIGCHMGASGLLGVDLDTYKEGGAELPAADLQTLTSVTGKGGRHLVYRMPDGKRYGGSSGDLPANIDIKGWGGYLVLPPSIHPDTGKAYQWQDGHGPGDVDAAPLPAAIVEALERPQRSTVTARPGDSLEYDTPEIEQLQEALRHIPPQGSYEDWLSVLMAIYDVYPNDTGIALAESWSPGYPGEIEKKFASFGKRPAGDRITVGTLYHLAKQHGYTPPKPKTPDPVPDRSPYHGLPGRHVKLTGRYLTHDDLPLPDGARLRVHGPTGIGKTTWALSTPGRVLLAAPTHYIIEQQYRRAAAAGRRPGIYHGKEKGVSGATDAILTTYDSARHAIKAAELVPEETTLFIDEGHNAAAAASYRQGALNGVLDLLRRPWRAVVMMTATPLPLSHPDAAQLVPVYIDHPPRPQNAVIIDWRKTTAGGKRRGHLIDSSTSMMLSHRDKLTIVYLQNKRERLEDYVAALEAGGVPREQIACVNADDPENPVSRSILDRERIPAGVRYIFVTSVLVEGANIVTAADYVYFITGEHPALMHQLVNRFRTQAVHEVRIFLSGEGRGYSVPTDDFIRAWQGVGAAVLNLYRSTPALDPEADTVAALLRRHSTRIVGGRVGGLVRSVVDEAGGKRWELNHVNIDGAVFEEERAYMLRNPEALKRYLVRYGWRFAPDRTHYARADKATRQARRIRAQELQAAREAAWQRWVDVIMGDTDAANLAALQRGGLDAVETRARAAANGIMKALTKDADPAQTVGAAPAFDAAWLAACAMTGETVGSTRLTNRIVRQISLQRLRKSGDKLTRAIVREIYRRPDWTGDELRIMFLRLFARHPVLRQLTIEMGYSWRADGGGLMSFTARKAVTLAGDFVKLRRTSTRDPDRPNVYRVEASTPLPPLVPILDYDPDAGRIHSSAAEDEKAKVNTERGADAVKMRPDAPPLPANGPPAVLPLAL